MRRAIGVLAAALLAAGCKGNEGPVAGELSLRLTSPRNTDRAVQLMVTGGPQHGVTAPSGSGYVVFADTSAVGDTSRIVVVSAAGTGLIPGEIARIAVPDTRQAGKYAPKLVNVAAAALTVGDTAGVSLSIVRP